MSNEYDSEGLDITIISIYMYCVTIIDVYYLYYALAQKNSNAPSIVQGPDETSNASPDTPTARDRQHLRHLRRRLSLAVVNLRSWRA